MSAPLPTSEIANSVAGHSFAPATGSATDYDEWLEQADRKWRRRGPYSITWKLWGQMPIRAFRIGWMACAAWHRLKRKSQNK